MRGDIDSISIKMTDSDIEISRIDEYIYWIHYSTRRGGYKIKTQNHDYFIKDIDIISIDVKYKEEY